MIISPKIELLAPCGDLTAIEAAISAGADAVYFGLQQFNARAGAQNITLQQLASIMPRLKILSIRAYLALNVLLLDQEIEDALKLLAEAINCGIDGVIVQDTGLAYLIRHNFPDFPIHASTQMTITDLAGIKQAAQLGFKRVVLSRELNRETLKELTKAAKKLNLEIEVFVHGALCIAYSGQCLLSSLEYGSGSANRGACIQPCRLNYSLFADATSMGENYPLLSPRDQALLEQLADLIAIGVTSLKIEGRMRSSEYVLVVLDAYREAIDNYYAKKYYRPRLDQLLIAFNRGGAFTDRYYSDDCRQEFLTGAYPGSYGLKIGVINKVEARQGKLTILLDSKVNSLPARKDIISVRREGYTKELASAPIGTLEQRANLLHIKAFHPRKMILFRPGDNVFRMTDINYLRELKSKAQEKVPIAARLEILNEDQAGYLLSLALTIKSGFMVETSATQTKHIPRKTALTSAERLREQIGKLGASDFYLDSFIMQPRAYEDLFISVADINNLRRQALKSILAEVTNNTIMQRINLHNLDFTPPQTLTNHLVKMPARGATQLLAKNMIKELADEPIKIPANVSKVIISNAKPYQELGPRRLNEIGVYYQRLPVHTERLTCGADYYYVPLWALDENTGPKLAAKFKSEEPNCKLIAWMPTAPQNKIASWVDRTIASLGEWGFDGLCSGHPGLSFLPVKDLSLFIDSTANITNTFSCKKILGKKPAAIALSHELSLKQLAFIVNQSFDELSQRATAVQLPVYGRQRVLSSIFCPVGRNMPACKLCHQEDTLTNLDYAKKYMLTDGKQRKMILQTHPLFCTTDLLSSHIFFAEDTLEHWQQLVTGNIKTIYNFHFFEENINQKQTLVSLTRNYLDEGTTNANKDHLVKLKQAAAAIASRQKARLETQRRNTYDNRTST